MHRACGPRAARRRRSGIELSTPVIPPDPSRDKASASGAGAWRPWALAGGLALVVGVASAVLAWAPWIAAGLVFGGALLAVTVIWPLPVVTVLLFLSPLDLAFLTGGFKGLFEQFGGLDMNGIRLVGVTAGLALLILGNRAEWGRIREAPVRWYAMFLVYASLSLLVSGDPGEGLRLLFKLAWPLLIYLTVTAPQRTSAEIDRVVDWILVGATILILINPFFVLGGNVVVEVSGDVRVGGAGIHQNPFSFYMLVIVLLSLGRFAGRAQIRYVLLALAAIFWMALTLTRITLLAGLVALAAAGLYGSIARRQYRPVMVSLGLATVIAAALTPVVLTRTFGYMPGPGELIGLLTDPVALYGLINWQGRELLWGVLVTAWMASPLVGLGLGSSSGILKSLFTREMGTVAHNEYVRLGTDTGFLGIGLFFTAMMSWIRLIVTLKGGDDPRVQEVALPALSVVLAWGVVSITDNAFDYYAPFTQYAGFLVGASVVTARDLRQSGLRQSRPGQPEPAKSGIE